MSIRTEPFIHHILNTYISLFYCISPKFPFKRLRKTSFSYSTAIEIHDCCLTSNSSLSATLLLLQPIPLPLSKAYLHVKAKILLVSVVETWPSLNHLTPGDLSLVALQCSCFLLMLSLYYWNQLLGTSLPLFWESQNEVLYML